jgi:hypothetical protein
VTFTRIARIKRTILIDRDAVVDDGRTDPRTALGMLGWLLRASRRQAPRYPRASAGLYFIHLCSSPSPSSSSTRRRLLVESANEPFQSEVVALSSLLFSSLLFPRAPGPLSCCDLLGVLLGRFAGLATKRVPSRLSLQSRGHSMGGDELVEFVSELESVSVDWQEEAGIRD